MQDENENEDYLQFFLSSSHLKQSQITEKKMLIPVDQDEDHIYILFVYKI